ncbi:MAG: alpha/beta hydrolase [Flavobacteriaceae bacterium]|nr:alpha/beta hydrolase [Flavobacteriaceae bacterium]
MWLNRYKVKLFRKSRVICLSTLIFGYAIANGQEKILYKTTNNIELFIEKYDPPKKTNSNQYPAMVFFFGGGWNKGSIHQFKPHAKYFSSRGFVCFLVDYRVTTRHNSTPFESLKDAKSAFRFIRKNATQYQIDANKIVGVGASAGGQLVAAAALIDKYNEVNDDTRISAKPNVLVLFNPAIDNGPGGVGYDRVSNDYQNFSPIHNIKKDAPPTIILSGTKDELIPVATVKKYQSQMQSFSNRCDLYLYDGAKHGFFNYHKFKNYKNTLQKTDEFLQSLGYLAKTPFVEIK